MATRTEWLKTELSKPQYTNMMERGDTRRLAATLIAPTLTPTPGEGKITIVPSTEQIMNLIPYPEWLQIIAPTAMWSTVTKAAVTDENLHPALMGIDKIMARSTVGDPTVKAVVLAVLDAEIPDLMQGLMQALVMAGLLSAESAQELAAAMVVDAPEMWAEGQSIAALATGSDEWLTESMVAQFVGATPIFQNEGF